MSNEITPPARPRVLQVVTHLGLGGAERVMLTLVRQLKDACAFGVFAVRGIEDSAVGRQLRDELAALGIPVYLGTTAPIKRGGLLLAGWRATRAMRDFRPNLIHLHTEIPEATYAVALTFSPGLRRLPLIRTIHNAMFWHHWARVGAWCEGRMPPYAATCVSIAAREAFLAFRSRARATTAIPEPGIIINGVPEPILNPRPTPAADGTLRLLFAGRFEAQKGADLIPQIVAQIASGSTGRFELDVYGNGTYENLLREMALSPPPGWAIRVAGPMAHLERELGGYDFVLMPSRFEGLGLLAVESSLAGVPVIATNGPGIGEALPPGYPWRATAGDPREFARLLREAIAQPARTLETAAQAKQYARARFSVVAMGTAYLALYMKSVAQP